MNTVARVKQLAAERGFTLHSLSVKCGVPYSTLKNAELRNSQLSVDTIELICTGLEISLAAFFTISP